MVNKTGAATIEFIICKVKQHVLPYETESSKVITVDDQGNTYIRAASGNKITVPPASISLHDWR